MCVLYCVHNSKHKHSIYQLCLEDEDWQQGDPRLPVPVREGGEARRRETAAATGGRRGRKLPGRNIDSWTEISPQKVNNFIKLYLSIIVYRIWPERLFWLLACLFGFTCAVYLIYKVFEKAHYNPVLVSFASETTPIWEIPFPALTICNMNKVFTGRMHT